MQASEFLSRAQSEMQDRAQTYDSPDGERSMASTVAAFNALTGHSLTEEQGWKFMACLKLARSEQGDFRADNFVDGAAYFGLAGEAAASVEREDVELIVSTIRDLRGPVGSSAIEIANAAKLNVQFVQSQLHKLDDDGRVLMRSGRYVLSVHEQTNRVDEQTSRVDEQDNRGDVVRAA